MVVVRLARLEPDGLQDQEKTFTDNISSHGVRVLTTRLWHSGQVAEITPVNEGASLRGKVVYFQKLDETHFCIGLSFSQKIPWLIQQRFDGID